MKPNHAETTADRQRVPMRRRLVVDVGACSRCCGCVELASGLFRMREDTGLIEVLDADGIDDDVVAEVMKYCPEDCIHWEED